MYNIIKTCLLFKCFKDNCNYPCSQHFLSHVDQNIFNFSHVKSKQTFFQQQETIYLCFDCWFPWCLLQIIFYFFAYIFTKHKLFIVCIPLTNKKNSSTQISYSLPELRDYEKVFHTRLKHSWFDFVSSKL